MPNELPYLKASELPVRSRRFAWLNPIHRTGLSVVGSFVVAAAFTAALALIIATEGLDTPENAFYWASFAASFVYFGAAVWCYAAQDLKRVWFGFGGVTLLCATIVWALGGDANFGYGAAFGRFVLLALLSGTLWFGFAALALSQDKHWASVTRHRTCPPATRLILRWLGWGLLGSSIILSIVRDGFAFGILMWPLMAFFVGLAVSFAIAYLPRLLSGFAAYLATITNVEAAEETQDAA